MRLALRRGQDNRGDGKDRTRWGPLNNKFPLPAPLGVGRPGVDPLEPPPPPMPQRVFQPMSAFDVEFGTVAVIQWWPALSLWAVYLPRHVGWHRMSAKVSRVTFSDHPVSSINCSVDIGRSVSSLYAMPLRLSAANGPDRGIWFRLLCNAVRARSRLRANAVFDLIAFWLCFGFGILATLERGWDAMKGSTLPALR